MKQVKIVSLMGILTMIVLNPEYAQDMTFEREIIVMLQAGSYPTASRHQPGTATGYSDCRSWC